MTPIEIAKLLGEDIAVNNGLILLEDGEKFLEDILAYLDKIEEALKESPPNTRKVWAYRKDIQYIIWPMVWAMEKQLPANIIVQLKKFVDEDIRNYLSDNNIGLLLNDLYFYRREVVERFMGTVPMERKL